MIGTLRGVALILMSSLFLVGSDASAQEPLQGELFVWQLHIDYVRSLIAKEPSLPHHYMRLAQAYSSIGKEAEVLEYTEEAVRRGGNPLAADILVGDFYASQERHIDALDRYLPVLSAAPGQLHVLTQVWLIVQRARTDHIELGVDLELLVGELNRQGFFVGSGRPSGDSERCLEKLDAGNRALAGGNTLGAVAAYLEAADADPWNPKVYRAIGIAYARDGRVAEAIGAYHLYTVLAPPTAEDVPKVRQLILDFYRGKQKQ